MLSDCWATLPKPLLKFYEKHAEFLLKLCTNFLKVCTKDKIICTSFPKHLLKTLGNDGRRKMIYRNNILFL